MSDYKGMLEDDWYQSQFLPMKFRKGEWDWGVPGMIQGPWDAWKREVDSAYGKGPGVTTDQQIEDALSVGSLALPMGAVRGGFARGAVGRNMARAVEKPSAVKAATHGAYAEDSVKGDVRAQLDQGLANLRQMRENLDIPDDTYSGAPVKIPEYKQTPVDVYMKWADETITTPEDKAGWARFLRKERSLEGYLDPGDAAWLKRYEAETTEPTHAGTKTVHDASGYLSALLAAVARSQEGEK